MIKFIKQKLPVITAFFVNILLIAKYFYDKVTICCEPCPKGIDCPPCQTDFMKYFWIWILVFTALIITSYIYETEMKICKS